MPFQRPSLTDLIERARNDFAVVLNVAPLRRSVEDALARVVAGASHGLHGHLDWVADQILPDSADDDFLLRWARLLGLELLPSQTATGTATFTSTGPGIGAGVRAQTVDGQEYEVRLAALEVGGNVSVFLDALEPGGAANQPLGTPITLTTPIAGIETTGTIGTMSGGAEPETPDQLRVRVLRRLATPPRGGAAGDYEAWALEVPGVARAWERLSGSTVQLYFLDGTAGTSQLLFPTAERQGEVRSYVRRPRASRAAGERLRSDACACRLHVLLADAEHPRGPGGGPQRARGRVLPGNGGSVPVGRPRARPRTIRTGPSRSARSARPSRPPQARKTTRSLHRARTSLRQPRARSTSWAPSPSRSPLSGSLRPSDGTKEAWPLRPIYWPSFREGRPGRAA